MNERDRRLAAALIVAGLMVGGAWLARRGDLSAEALGAWMRSLGSWSAPAFVLAFVGGQLLHLPGMAFVAAARIGFGPLGGFALAYLGAVTAVTVPFLIARRLRRSREPYRSRFAPIRKLLERADRHPLRSVVLSRLVLWLSPPLSYAFAFTAIRTRHYVLGSALGLLPGIAAVVWATGCLA